jgi:steroid 5-alpha reductase family enzyme
MGEHRSVGTEVALANLVAVGICMLILWFVSLALKNASIVDPFWGTGFVIVSWVTFFRLGEMSVRTVLLLAMVTLWGLRLSLYLLIRNLPHGEDFRYRAMRKSHGARFWWVSLFTVFSFQGILMWLLSTPLALSIAYKNRQMGVFEILGALIWLVGFSFEAIGDAQLRAFKRDPKSAGQVMDRGLWRYTRHPNYFGESVLWWGYGIFALSAPGGAYALLAPAAMTFLLLRVSGVTLLEKSLVNRRAGYREYIERTSAFFPMPQRPEGTRPTRKKK